MKKKNIFKSLMLVLLGLCLNITSTFAQDNVIAAFRARNADPSAVATDNASATGFVRGSGIITSTGDNFTSEEWPLDPSTIADAENTDSYIEWSITADAGFTISISSIAFRYSGGANGPTNMVMRYSTDGFSSNSTDIYSDNSVGNVTVETTFTPTGGTITSTTGGTLTFRIYAYNAVTDGGRFLIRNTPGVTPLGQLNTGIYFIGSVDTEWNGSISTDWNNANNWDAGVVPIATTSVIIPDVTNAPIVSGITGESASVNNLTILEPDGITLGSLSTLIVHGNMDVVDTSTGSVIYNRQMPSAPFWNLVSSPVAGETYNNAFVADNNLAINNTNNAIGTYNSATNTWTYMQTGGSGTFTSGQAYTMRLADNEPTQAITFIGTPNDDDVVVSVATGYNLLGNPYTANIQGTAFLGDASNTSIDQTQLWTWNPSSSAYDVTIAASSIELIPGDGFFVRATSAGSVTFDKDNQQSVFSIVGPKELETMTEVKLLMADGKTERYAKIYFAEDLSKGFDYGWEGEIFGGTKSSLSVYSYLINDNEGTKYQIQSLPNSDYESLVVPIGITAAADKEITFTTEALNLPTGIKVFLEDRDTNTFTRLDEPNSEYKVTFTEAVDGAGRFYLHTKSSVLSTPEVSLDDVSVFSPNASTLSITGLSQGKADVRLFNILGKQVFKDSFTSNGVKNISLPNLTSGVYIVQLATEAGQLNKKITLE